jgi:hypothetical protein
VDRHAVFPSKALVRANQSGWASLEIVATLTFGVILLAAFVANGHLGTPASVTDGFRPALAAYAGFALLATLSAIAITSRAGEPVPAPAT